MTDPLISILDGPDKPALQWALLYPERGQSVTFKTETDTIEARIEEMVELGNGFQFELKGAFASGQLKDQPFRGTYSVETRTGSLILDP
jgi:hypothetical protein